MIIRHRVDAGDLRSVGYDPEHKVLEVELASGSVYHYHGVPDNLYEELRSSDEKEEYFDQQIKPYYRVELIEGHEPGV